MTAFFNLRLKEQESSRTWLTGAEMAKAALDGLVTFQSKNGF